jgi:hypothetical protein
MPFWHSAHFTMPSDASQQKNRTSERSRKVKADELLFTDSFHNTMVSCFCKNSVCVPFMVVILEGFMTYST